MDTGSVLHPPKRQIVTTAIVNTEPREGLYQGLVLSGSEYDWAGRPTSSNRLLAPAFYHRGGWLALSGLDPTTTGTPNSAYWTAITASSVTMRNTQYGTAWESASRHLPKPPTTVFYNMLLATAPAASGSGLFTTSNYNGFGSTAEGMIGNSTALTAANAFVALIDPCNFWYYSGKVLMWPFPPQARVTITQTVNAVNYSNVTKVVDESLVTGGNLLVLSGFYLNPGGGTRSGTEYYDVQSDIHGTIIKDNVLSSLIATDMDVLARCYPKFRRFSHYIYAWGTRTTTAEIAVSDTVWAHLQSTGATAAQYGVTVRGLYTTGVDDLSTVVAADVKTFLDGL